AAPGGVAVSATAYTEASKHISVALVDAGSHRFKNIAEPVHVWTWEPGGSDGRARRPSETSNLPAQYRTAIVGVLPFANLSGSDDEYFSDGLTEDLIHALSLQSFYRVLSRNSTFSFKGKNLSTRIIAREIDASYLIQGSVRRAGSKIRVTAELIAPENGEQLWTGRYDRDIGDLFARITSTGVAWTPAMTLAGSSVRLGPRSSFAFLILSYLHAAEWHYEAAMDAANRAVAEPVRYGRPRRPGDELPRHRRPSASHR